MHPRLKKVLYQLQRFFGFLDQRIMVLLSGWGGRSHLNTSFALPVDAREEIESHPHLRLSALGSLFRTADP